MAFTDNDLKQLKEWLTDAGGPTDWKTSDSDKIRALLARLEAAEKANEDILNLASEIRMDWSDFDGRWLLQKVREFQVAWRKEAGK